MTDHTIEDNKQYWNNFYREFQKYIPSQFCVSVITDLPKDSVIVELGSGNGRDSLYFATQGFTTLALDLSEVAVKACQDYCKAQGLEVAHFVQADITDATAVAQAVDTARAKSASGALVFYSRFVMHSLNDAQQQLFLQTLSTCSHPEDVIYFEFRSTGDGNLKKHFGGHYRRYVNTSEFDDLANIAGFDVTYAITGQGMAKFKEEDPIVSRIIAAKKRRT
jgi:hypothetical protein